MRAPRPVLLTLTLCTFVREFSPLGLRTDPVEEGLSPIDTRAAAGAVWSPNVPVLRSATSRGVLALRDTSWHPSFTATAIHRVKNEPFAERGKPGPRLDDMSEVLVAADGRQAGRQALLPDARKCLSQQYLQIQGSRFDSPRLHLTETGPTGPKSGI